MLVNTYFSESLKSTAGITIGIFKSCNFLIFLYLPASSIAKAIFSPEYKPPACILNNFFPLGSVYIALFLNINFEK